MMNESQKAEQEKSVLRWGGLAGMLQVPRALTAGHTLSGGSTDKVLSRRGRQACAFLSKRIGKYGLVNFILIFLSLALYGANLYMDAFTNTVLAKYEPVLQTQWHSASLGMDTPLTELLGPALFATPIAMIILLLSGVSFGIVLIRAKILPWYVGALFIIGATVLGTGAMLPYRVVAIGYGGIGLAIAVPGFLIFSGKVERKSEASSRHAVTTTTQPSG